MRLLYPLSYKRTLYCGLIISDLRDRIFSFSTPPQPSQPLFCILTKAYFKAVISPFALASLNMPE